MNILYIYIYVCFCFDFMISSFPPSLHHYFSFQVLSITVLNFSWYIAAARVARRARTTSQFTPASRSPCQPVWCRHWFHRTESRQVQGKRLRECWRWRQCQLWCPTWKCVEGCRRSLAKTIKTG